MSETTEVSGRNDRISPVQITASESCLTPDNHGLYAEIFMVRIRNENFGTATRNHNAVRTAQKAPQKLTPSHLFPVITH